MLVLLRERRNGDDRCENQGKQSSSNHCPTAIKNRCVRKYRTPSEIAGVAIPTSPSGFVAIRSNVRPAFSTCTSPSSLVT